MSQLVRVMLAGLLTGLTLAGPASAAPATAVLGDSSVGGNCTESDLDTALAVGGTITFNCGGPKAISITAVKTITQATILNGADGHHALGRVQHAPVCSQQRRHAAAGAPRAGQRGQHRQRRRRHR